GELAVSHATTVEGGNQQAGRGICPFRPVVLLEVSKSRLMRREATVLEGLTVPEVSTYGM
ncbi:hypothetical protein, partial [Candidatus Nitrospira salsa]